MENLAGANVTFSCDEVELSNYDVIISVVCGVLCLFGFVYTFFGYRCFKAVMFLSGLIFGGTIVFLMCREERIFQQTVSVEIAAGIALGIGFVCGFITMLVKHIGLFLQGFFLGLLIAFAGILALQSFYHPSTPWIPVGILFGTGVLFSVLTLKFQKKFIIFSTSVFGSVLFVLCIDYFIEKFLLFLYAWEALMAAPSVPVCWYSWIILSMWPTFSLAGILLQWKVTSKGYDHTDDYRPSDHHHVYHHSPCHEDIHVITHHSSERRNIIIVRGRRKQVRTHLVRQQRPTSRSSTERHPRTHRNSAVVSNRRALNNDPPRAQDVERGAPPPGQQEDTSASAPPTYFECVELGVGEPVREEDQIVRTEKGAYLHRHASSSQPPASENSLMEQLRCGDGYALDIDQPTTSNAASGGVPSRESPRASRRPRNGSPRPAVPDHEPIELFSADPETAPSNRRKKHRHPKIKHRNPGSASKSYKVSAVPGQAPSGQSGRSDSDRAQDTQSLLSNSKNARCHRDVIAAHSQRIHKAQAMRVKKQTPRKTIIEEDTPSAPSGSANV